MNASPADWPPHIGYVSADLNIKAVTMAPHLQKSRPHLLRGRASNRHGAAPYIEIGVRLVLCFHTGPESSPLLR